MYSCPSCSCLVTFDHYAEPQCRCTAQNNNIKAPMKPALRWTLIALTALALLAWLWVYSPAAWEHP